MQQNRSFAQIRYVDRGFWVLKCLVSHTAKWPAFLVCRNQQIWLLNYYSSYLARPNRSFDVLTFKYTSITAAESKSPKIGSICQLSDK